MHVKGGPKFIFSNGSGAEKVTRQNEEKFLNTIKITENYYFSFFEKGVGLGKGLGWPKRKGVPGG